MTTQEELCPEYRKYLEWYDREVMPEFNKFIAHLANCPKCQRLIVTLKDKMAIEALKMPDEAFIEVLREYKGNEKLPRY